MKEEGHVSEVKSPISGITLVLVGFLFVDDTDLVIFGNKKDSATAVHDRLQKAIDCWNGVLRVSGGALKPEKCYWYFAQFSWTKGKWSLKEEEPPPISIETDNGTRENIEYKYPSDSTKAVGVWQDLIGTSSKQVKELVDKVKKIHIAMEASPVPRHLAWIGLKQSIWKSIEYVLPATTMTCKEAALLAKELYRPLLPKLGVNRNFPLLLRYNPPFLMGLDLHDPYVEQGLLKLLILVNHGATDTMTGKFLQTSIEHHQLEIGSCTSLFHLDYKKYSFLTSPTWLTVLWEFISEHNINVRNAQPNQPQPLRQHDMAIMDTFINNYVISNPILLSINRVRCYLQLFFISDIATGDGLKIRNNYAQGHRGDTVSKWDWHEEHPSNEDFVHWKWAMTILIDERNLLHNPLGNWIAKPHHKWKWYFEAQNDIIFSKNTVGWTSYHRALSATRTNPIYIRSHIQVTPSCPLSYTTIFLIDANVILFGGSDYNTVDNLPPTIPIHCDSFWTLQHSNIKNEYNKVWVTDGLREGTLKAVCDGSYKPKLTSKGITAAFVIESRNNNSQIIGTIATSGITSDPYRGELLGIYATLSAVSYIERYNQAFTTGKLRIGCDNEKAG